MFLPHHQSVTAKYLEIRTWRDHVVPNSSVQPGNNPSKVLPRTKDPLTLISGPNNELHSLATVDDDIFWHDPSLQHAHLGVVATATEKPRRFYLEVGNPLSVVIHNTEAIFFQ